MRPGGRWVPLGLSGSFDYAMLFAGVHFHSFGTAEYVLVCRWVYLVSFVHPGAP